MDDQSDFVEIGRVTSLVEADVVCAALAAEGIDAFVPGMLATNAMSHLSGGLNPKGLKILAPAAKAKEGRMLLAEWSERKAARLAEVPEGDELDESAKAEGIVWARSAWRAALIALVMPIPFLLLAMYALSRTGRESAGVAPADLPGFRRAVGRAIWAAWAAVILWGVIIAMIAMALTDEFPVDIDWREWR